MSATRQVGQVRHFGQVEQVGQVRHFGLVVLVRHTGLIEKDGPIRLSGLVGQVGQHRLVGQLTNNATRPRAALIES